MKHIFFIAFFLSAVCGFPSFVMCQEPFNPLSPENITVTPLDEPAKPLSDDEAILHEGYTLFKQENYEQAENIFSAFLAEHPDHYRTALMLANVLYKQNRTDEALAYYHKCIELAPDEPHGYYNIGLIYLEKNDLQSAVQFLRKAERINPNNENILYFLGDILFASGDYSTALDYFTRVYSLNNGRMHNLLRIADCFQALERYDEEIQTYLVILQMRQSAYVYHKLGLAYHNIGNLTEEVSAYINALKLSPTDDGLRFNLALTYYETGFIDDALIEFNKISEPTDDVHYYKALIYMKLGDVYSAWEQHEQLQRLNQEKADEIYSLLNK